MSETLSLSVVGTSPLPGQKWASTIKAHAVNEAQWPLSGRCGRTDGRYLQPGFGGRTACGLMLWLIMFNVCPAWSQSEAVHERTAPRTLESQRLFFSPEERLAQKRYSKRTARQAGEVVHDDQTGQGGQTLSTADVPGSLVDDADNTPGTASNSSAQKQETALPDSRDLGLSPAYEQNVGSSRPSRNEIVFHALITHDHGTRILVNGLPCRQRIHADHPVETAVRELYCLGVQQHDVSLAVIPAQGKLQVLRDGQLVQELTPGESWR